MIFVVVGIHPPISKATGKFTTTLVLIPSRIKEVPFKAGGLGINIVVALTGIPPKSPKRPLKPAKIPSSLFGYVA
jgi:hypothetical protein